LSLYSVPIDAAGRLSLVTCPRPATLDADVADLVEAGVTLVVSALPEEDEADLGLTAEATALGRHGIDFLRIPIEDVDVPADTESVLTALKDVLDRLAAADQHVAVHCLGGLGRSPLLAGSLLVLTGDDPESAWRIVAAARRRPVPETPEQRAWVERLREG
jgi:protein-tyrosine phosphatase